MNAWPIYRGDRVELIQTSHQQLAIRAAQAGNWKPADSLELDRLRRAVKPHHADGEPYEFSDVRPAHILRCRGPKAADVSVWVTKGRFEPEVLITDLDGLILEDHFS